MKKLFLFIPLLFALNAFAEEQADLTTNYDPDSRSYSVLKVAYLNLNRLEQIIDVGLYLTQNEGVVLKHRYTGSTALNLMNSLNKADLTTNTLNKRILSQLITDGVIDGTVSGNPE